MKLQRICMVVFSDVIRKAILVSGFVMSLIAVFGPYSRTAIAQNGHTCKVGLSCGPLAGGPAYCGYVGNTQNDCSCFCIEEGGAGEVGSNPVCGACYYQ